MLQRFVAPFLLLISLGLYLGCVHSVQKTEGATPSTAQDRTHPRAVASDAADPSFSNLVDLIRDEKISKIGALLERLSVLYPSYLSHHVLAYESLSLQDASYAHPRAMVFGETAKMVISFNGDASQRGYSSLETMTFSEKKGYEFREIVFAGEPVADASVENPETAKSEIEFRLPGATVSQANPMKCLQCHSSDNPRPIWQPYFVWPGMYGSDDDRLFRDKTVPSYSISRMANGKKDFVDTEQKGFQAYMAARNDHERYKYLPNPKGVSSVYDLTYGDQRLELRPNATLLLLLSDQISRMIVEDVSHRPNALRNLALLAAVKCFDENRFGTDREPRALRSVLNSAHSYDESYRQAAFEVLIEDVTRQLKNFGGELTFKANHEKPMNFDEEDLDMFSSRRKPEPFVIPGLRKTLVTDIVAGVWHELLAFKAFKRANANRDVTTEIAAALKSMGIDFNRYTFSLRRTNYYQDGVSGPRILEPASAKIQELRGLSAPPNCLEIGELLERMKN